MYEIVYVCMYVHLGRSVLQWLRDGLGLIQSAADSESEAEKVA